MAEQGRRLCGARHQPVCRSEQDDRVPARGFRCARCDRPAIICHRCDRGQIYCVGEDCAGQARREAQRTAGRRYQVSRRGRLSHAARARRYRARQKNVTHQGSPAAAVRDQLAAGLAMTANDAASRSDQPGDREWRCDWCHCRCPQMLRLGFLREYGLHRGRARPIGRACESRQPPCRDG